MSCDDSEQQITFHTIDSRTASHPTPQKTSTWIQILQEAHETFVSKCFPDEELEPFEVWERLLLRPPEHAKYRLSISVGLVTVVGHNTAAGNATGGGGGVVERCAGISVVEIYESSQSLWLAYLAVDEAFRRFGIAKRLVALAAQLLNPSSHSHAHTPSLGGVGGGGGGGGGGTGWGHGGVPRHFSQQQSHLNTTLSGSFGSLSSMCHLHEGIGGAGDDAAVSGSPVGNTVAGGGGRFSQLWAASPAASHMPHGPTPPSCPSATPPSMQQLFLCAKRCHGGTDAVAPQLRHKFYRNAGFVPFQFDYFDCGRLRSIHPSALAVYRPDRSPLHASVTAVDGPDGTAFAYPGPPLYHFIKDLYEASLAEEGKTLTFELHPYESFRDAQSVALCSDSFWT